MIIGFSGFARAGKNTAAEEFAKLTEAECKHFAFARTLKQDLQPCIDALGAFADKASFKEEFRPMYVLWSRVAKEIAKNPNFWVERITPEIIEYDRDDNFSLITDVRYYYEYAWILNKGGIVLYIERPDNFPANEEEAYSFNQIKIKYPNIFNNPIINSGTKEFLGLQVLNRYLKSLRDVDGNS